MCATPVFYVTMRSDQVWFFAQTVGFFLVTGAIHAIVVQARPWLAGAFIGLAFLTRQMSVFYAPFLLVLAFQDERPLWHITWERLKIAIQIAIPIGIAILAYFAYNYARFGSPLDTGYGYIFSSLDTSIEPEAGDYIAYRLRELGLFNREYLLFNAFYLFFQGLHVEFGGRYLTEITGIDINGTSLLAASPFLFVLFLTPLRRHVVVGLGVIAIVAGITLFYHSNGFSQHHVQRYTLDWLPIAFTFLPLVVLGPRIRALFAVMTLYAMGTLALALAIAQMTAA